MFHSIELTMVTFVLGMVEVFAGPTAVWPAATVCLVVAIWLVTAGHLLAIWKSPRLVQP